MFYCFFFYSQFLVSVFSVKFRLFCTNLANKAYADSLKNNNNRVYIDIVSKVFSLYYMHLHTLFFSSSSPIQDTMRSSPCLNTTSDPTSHPAMSTLSQEGVSCHSRCERHISGLLRALLTNTSDVFQMARMFPCRPPWERSRA